MQSLVNTKYSPLKTDSSKDKAKLTLMITTDIASWSARLLKAQKMQEFHNRMQYPLSQILKNSKNPNMLATNSEEYLTYQFKQSLPKNFENYGSL